ncbi:U3 small nucleolar RNA-associated protein 25 homolog [Artemia franciscana]|uniref:U3 small nucleolar RNA-associated protein 25 homolog n=1 Tax=Artemia franciscana TaxID=6661 RepID=A0AA88KWT6_ARTSF|nr:hypothetical protein QYM36_013854 [Artemia franciscana]
MKRGRGRQQRRKNHKKKKFEVQPDVEERQGALPSKLLGEYKKESESESSEDEDNYYNQVLNLVASNKDDQSELESELDESRLEEEEEALYDGSDSSSQSDEVDSDDDLLEGEPDEADPRVEEGEEFDELESNSSEAEDINNSNSGDASIQCLFRSHLEHNLPENLATVGVLRENYENEQRKWPQLGQINITIAKESFLAEANPNYAFDLDIKSTRKHPLRVLPQKPVKNVSELNVKPQILKHCGNLNKLQLELFTLFNQYLDLHYPERSNENGEDIRFTYCFHALNHLLKSRSTVLHHNEKLKKGNYLDVPDSFRDQGLVRPKVLIVLPFKESALRTVKIVSDILLGGDTGGSVINKKRFLDEFGEDGEGKNLKKNIHKPEDYQETFKGNTDDSFRIGMAITKKSLKLYTNFYNSDLIIASPLGLRMIIGAEGEKDRDFDFLTSVELLIIDQCDVLLMQNWEHVLHLFSHLHLQPQDTHGTDLSRVRMYVLDGLAKYYRQTLVFSSMVRPEINALTNKHCFNYFGKGFVFNKIDSGTVGQVVVQLPQAFHRIEASSPQNATEARFQYFIEKIVPQFRNSSMKHTLIFVPSYFDYVKLRNYFKKEEVNFTQICEYTEDGKTAKARDMFFHGKRHLMLYTGRCHFYKRFRIKGVRHIVFYELPIQPHFYSEICNLTSDLYQGKKSSRSEHKTCTILYSKFDVLSLANTVGSDRARQMIASDKKVHMLVTSDL